jgi:hypothetical protein
MTITSSAVCVSAATATDLGYGKHACLVDGENTIAWLKPNTPRCL